MQEKTEFSKKIVPCFIKSQKKESHRKKDSSFNFAPSESLDFICPLHHFFTLYCCQGPSLSSSPSARTNSQFLQVNIWLLWCNSMPEFVLSEEVCTLVITEAFPEDSGIFKCVAENEFGSAASSARLSVSPGKHMDFWAEQLSTREFAAAQHQAESQIFAKQKPDANTFVGSREEKCPQNAVCLGTSQSWIQVVLCFCFWPLFFLGQGWQGGDDVPSHRGVSSPSFIPSGIPA